MKTQVLLKRLAGGRVPIFFPTWLILEGYHQKLLQVEVETGLILYGGHPVIDTVTQLYISEDWIKGKSKRSGEGATT